MLTTSLSPILNAQGLPIRRGRPRNEDRISYGREYTAGGTSSAFASVNTSAQLERLHGNVDDMDLTLGWKEKDQMDNDPQCSAALDTLALGATARGIEVEPAKKALYTSDDDEAKANEIAEFIRRCLIYLSQTHRDLRLTAFQLGRNALKVGHSKSEQVRDLKHGGPDDMKEVPVRIKSKNRYNSCFVIDKQGNTVGIAGFTGDYGQWLNPYDTARLNGYLNASLLGPGWTLLPRDKWCVITNRPPEDDSPLGQSLYRRVHKPYRSKLDAYVMYLTALDNTASPFTVVTLPTHEYGQATYPLDDDGAPDTTADKVPMAEVIYDAVEKGRRAGTSVLPYSADAKYLHAAQSGDPFLSAMGFFNGEITQGILLQALATGTDKHMARAAGQVHQDILDLAMRHVRAMIADALTRDCFAVWTRANFPERYWHLAPSCSFGQVELNDFASWATAVKALAESGILVPSQFPHIWEMLGLPQGDLDELYSMLDTDEAINAALREPEVKPDGSTGPSQQERYVVQEYGKNLTRKLGRKRAGRQGATAI